MSVSFSSPEKDFFIVFYLLDMTEDIKSIPIKDRLTVTELERSVAQEMFDNPETAWESWDKLFDAANAEGFYLHDGRRHLGVVGKLVNYSGEGITAEIQNNPSEVVFYEENNGKLEQISTWNGNLIQQKNGVILSAQRTDISTNHIIPRFPLKVLLYDNPPSENAVKLIFAGEDEEFRMVNPKTLPEAPQI